MSPALIQSVPGAGPRPRNDPLVRHVIRDSDQMRRLYGRLAPYYDAALAPLRVAGLDRHRAAAVEALALRQGDVVLDLGCGTGLNFRPLHAAVGPAGRIVGVDLTPGMLAKARARAAAAGFDNVELVEADLLDYRIPAGVSGVVATYVLEAVPEYDAVIRRVAAALPTGGRVASYGLKHPETWPRWLVSLGAWLSSPFGVDRDYESFRPWESIERHLGTIAYREFLMGAAYLAVGERR